MVINMEAVKHKYGVFDKSQFADYKKRMQKKIFWLIIYTDPNTKEPYKDIDVVSYHKNIMEQISGFNSLLFHPSEVIDILCALESALTVLKQDEFNFKCYRKLVLDAGAMMDRLEVGD